MAERKYTDINGVTWTIANSGRSMLATVLDSAEPRYIPPAEDLTAVIPTPESDTPEARAEVERVGFIAVREKIDAFSKEHKDSVGLTVTAARDGVPWWVWVGLVILLARRK